MTELRITEIFLSLQGEAKVVGLPTVFVRLTGCPLRCGYCDSAYAFYGGKKISVDEILAQVRAFNVRHVCVTGGEPLAQPDVRVLLRELCDIGKSVSLETSGAMSIADVDPRVSVVMDIKTPGSGESHRNLLDNLPLLGEKDQIKFVICSREDYEWARFKLAEWNLAERAGEILFSPSYGVVNPRDLADWIVADRLPVRMQIQLHKLLWGDVPGV
ncbi:7-carboxy-7-deazaguanine synthase QueE [Saccharophagus sp. K07]|uniref:7-carboxy-7-deazaguanine synthase QueE n=1 Tax=Saccharophagus sp. K07 TaxID=2283636 RepID=UPI0016529D5B|nr:7-carboxy-7-deazaguanine synthase QueE [Saccharophagus sp. K07]MBC6906617.1 7-carboxy-7-deazaguanine synthase QueE [Saccharophagus sp. K07]